ncbi:GOLPH3/VPS74 family protein [Paractinoplanes lichenicola]|uniref:GPP34 family phosphoprotein n=1 Tax=Paractinoplanes lichenicola TaxID=2802976 RepID=A0ABS1VW27_9ACTN|nr:GPP34 family phosphoprotein [Actinoplanes lichenicola]MBL7258694.1 GPP34 family phosphoprotein [Actinoplanes lichenicola]
MEDLMLLLLDDETGVPAAAGTLPYTLGGAVLVELALLGRIGTDGDNTSWINDPKVHVTGEGPLDDPLLQEAYDKVAEKPRGAQSLLLHIGGSLYNPLIERLLERGLIRREKKRVLGIFKMNALPATESDYEPRMRDRIKAVLVDGAQPDTRTAALIALLSSSGALPMLRPQLAWSSPVIKRAKELEQGHWGAEAVNTAVTRTAAAIAVSTAAVTVTVVTSTN